MSLHIDPELASIIPEFLELKRCELKDLITLLGQEDYESIKRLGHKIKGSGMTYGFEAVTAFGIEIYKAADRRDLERIEREICEYEKALICIEKVVKELFINGGCTNEKENTRGR